MEYRDEWKVEDEEGHVESDVRTMVQIRRMANTIDEDIQMEEQTASQQIEKKLPILDFKV